MGTAVCGGAGRGKTIMGTVEGLDGAIVGMGVGVAVGGLGSGVGGIGSGIVAGLGGEMAYSALDRPLGSCSK